IGLNVFNELDDADFSRYSSPTAEKYRSSSSETGRPAATPLRRGKEPPDFKISFRLFSMHQTGFPWRSVPACREPREERRRPATRSCPSSSAMNRSTKCCSPSPPWRRTALPRQHPSARGQFRGATPQSPSEPRPAARLSTADHARLLQTIAQREAIQD